MQAIDTPKANPENLLALVREAYNAKIVVPEFQRSFVWGREEIEEFLASLLQGYFVGTFLMLDTQTAAPMFPFRTVEGLAQVNGQARPDQHQTVRLILDGQQRLTSTFYALYAPDIPLRGAKSPHKFYLRLDAALAGDLDEAVVGVSTRDRRRMAELQQLVAAHRALPFQRLRDSSAFYRWFYQEQDRWQGEAQHHIERLYHRLEKFMVPVVSLAPETGRDNIVNIFERINRTGVSLSLFDLLGARLYLKGVRVRELWQAFEAAHKAMARVIKPEFLVKVIAILQGKEPRKGNLLDVLDALTAEAFHTHWQAAAEALAQAYQRLTKVYGAFAEAWIPYTTMLVPLAAVLHVLKQRGAGEDAYRKVDRWYWASVLSQRYDSAVDTKSYQDVRDMRRWVEENFEPDWLESVAAETVDFGVEEPRAAVYRGLMCLIARQGARDFLTGQPADLHTCQDDHIFPRRYGAETILNRTLISKETNNRKRDKSPSAFLRECLAGHGNDESRLRATLRSHFIREDAYQAMQRDDLQDFLACRQRALTAAVGKLLQQGGLDNGDAGR
ncbi:MAG: hypothetical protein KatS3mg131_0299 [Candidatus Tectimicrobiota bacterium]|nr:MAG: hypothetical protein KatS3mg131_0299 [Candidatus Tectomicrobia bacterium]